jgi:hypothetical protein
MNSGDSPLLLPSNQLAFASNTTLRGAFATDRPPFRKITVTYPSDEVETAIKTGLWQGGCFYQPDFGNRSLMASISGRLFQYVISGNTANVIERTIPGDPNPDSTTQAWLWQSENYVIVQDGISLPIFFDGSTSRRSLGASQQLQLTAVDWTIPDIGSTVAVTLDSDYTGPLNTSIYIDGEFYEVVSSAAGSQATLTNLSGTPGETITAGTQLVFRTDIGFVLGADFVIAPGSYPENSTALLTLTAPYTGATGNGTPGVIIFGVPVTILSAVGNSVTVRFDDPFTATGTIPAGTLIPFLSSVDPNVVVGTVATSFIVPAIDSTVLVELNAPYSYTPNSLVFANLTDQFSIVAVPDPGSGTAIIVRNLTDSASGSRGPGGTEGLGQLSTVPELPAGRMGAYGNGRNWMSLVDGQSYVGGDIVGFESGTPSFAYRDAVLKMTANTYLDGGGVFRIPGSAGDIRAMIFASQLDTSLGQGPLLVGTPNRVFSCNAPIDETTWQNLTNPLQTQALIANGTLGQNSTIAVDGDTHFRSVDGWRSFVQARREFKDAAGNTPISHEVERILAFDVGDEIAPLLAYSSAMFFDTRVLFTSAPTATDQGVFFQAIVAMNRDGVTNLNEKSPPIYDGLWTGINVLQFVKGLFSGQERAYAFTLDVSTNSTSGIELYEILPTGTNHFDNGNIPITWTGESPVLFKDKGLDQYMQLTDGQIHIDEAIGQIDFRILYKPDQYPCWIPWHEWSICVEAGDELNPGYNPRMSFGEPPVQKRNADGTVTKLCNPMTKRVFREGYTFQVKWIITGHCSIKRIDVRGVSAPEPLFGPPICKPVCSSTP